MKTTIRVLVADDHPIFRKGLVDVIDTQPDMQVIADVGNGSEVLELIPNSDPEVVVLDIQMPGLTGLEVAKRIQAESIRAKVIILTAYKEEELFNEAIAVGAMGFVLKENAITGIVDSIRMVADGKMYISPVLSEFLVKQAKANRQVSNDFHSLLTTAELRILKMIALEKTSKQISQELFVSPKTIENHRANICKKLEINGANSLLKFVLLNRSLISEN
ncbi:MAG: DNA-binding response regulator [Flavobacteriales bacterium]|nr:MAG: DNA-binding response regulator [Flavobacteriales bacterium]